jgi:hypothetical protein
MEILGQVNVSKDDAAAIARGLFTLSRVDGHEEREGILIRSLWMDAVGTDSDVDFQAVEKLSDISPKDLAVSLRSTELHRMFLKTALLIAWADGNYSDKERVWIQSAAAAFGISDKDLAREDELVRTFLLSQLSNLANMDAAKEVAKKLGF